MLTERELRLKTRKSSDVTDVDAMQTNHKTATTTSAAATKKCSKRKATTSSNNNNHQVKRNSAEQNNNNNNNNSISKNGREDMFNTYQPWVIHTYGDLAKTKTITLKKYARILRTLRGDEIISADNSKFRFWVKAKGFHVGQPIGYDARPADAIIGRYSVCDADECIPPVSEKMRGTARDPSLYVPNAPFKNANGEPVHRKVAIVENFFDIIYSVHVELEGRPGKHAGQKRTYRTITETYAFLPREAVTRFLLGCTECQKHPRSPSPSPATAAAAPTPNPTPNNTAIILLPTPSPSPTPPPPIKESPPDLSNGHHHHPIESTPNGHKTQQQQQQQQQPENNAKSTHPLDVCNLLTTPTKKRRTSGSTASQHLEGVAVVVSSTPKHPNKLWSPARDNQENNKCASMQLLRGHFDYSMPITTTYLKYMRSLGCSDADAMQLESTTENLSTPESSENNDEENYAGTGAIMKDADKFKLMLLAWNYHNQAQGANRNGTANASEVPDLSALAGSEEMAGLWAQYHALGLAKSGGKATPPATRDQSSPVNAETGSAHDETSSSGNKEDEDDDDDESDDKIDAQTHDPERLKAFNMFVRLFVDENLDRMVPISKQPKEKIQAIIDSCTRQFPEFAERARKRIRTYLKSCRRNKRARDPNSPWDATRPTPAHLTSVQAEQILATACENESHNAKRMRLGLEPVSQPMPLPPGSSTTDTTAAMNRGLDFSSSTPVKMDSDNVSGVFPSSTTQSSSASTPNSISKGLKLIKNDVESGSLSNVSSALGGNTSLNGIGGIASTAAGSAPTAMYRPNFSQAFQRAGPYPLFPGQSPFGATTPSGLLTNGPADLSMKQKPLLNHKLSTGEMGAVRQLITGYRESAAFLLRSADELEQLLIQQQ